MRRALWLAILTEALASLGQKPTRTLLTMAGTVLGVGAFISVLGLTSTASGQISEQFSRLEATTVTVRDVATSEGGVLHSFPVNAEIIVANLNGVVHCGITWTAQQGLALVSTSFYGGGRQANAPVQIASPGFLETLEPSWATGGAYTQFEQSEGLPVAVLGASLARQLGVNEAGTSVIVDGFEWRVVGVLSAVSIRSEVMNSLLVPPEVGGLAFGMPTSSRPAEMLIRVEMGSAQQVAAEAPLAIRPDQPALLSSVPPPDPPKMKSMISGSMEDLFVALASITLLIGAASIANTTLVAVLERTGEIGLRRATGARSYHIIAQFLVETVLTGVLAGLVGSSLGVIVVLATAVSLHWTAVLPPWVVACGPLIGAGVGLVAGLYPAWRAGRVDPLEALRK